LETWTLPRDSEKGSIEQCTNAEIEKLPSSIGRRGVLGNPIATRHKLEETSRIIMSGELVRWAP
jgi:hypothetical protein